jgi:hypothetical protein
MSRQGLPDPNNKSGDAPPALTAQAGSDGPTARARAEGKPGLRHPNVLRGGAAGHRQMASRLYGAAMRSLIPLPSRQTGRGRKRKVKYCSARRTKLASERRVAANRENARRSTGPKTPQGKRAVRFNGLQHGLLSREAVLPGENEDEFEKFRNSMHVAFAPFGPIETLLADRVVNVAWRLQRLARLETALFHWRIHLLKAEAVSAEVQKHEKTTYTYSLSPLGALETQILDQTAHARATKELERCEYERDRNEVLLAKAMNADAKESDVLGRLARYETTLERGLYRALHELQRLQAARNGREIPLPQALDIDLSISSG